MSFYFCFTDVIMFVGMVENGHEPDSVLVPKKVEYVINVIFCGHAGSRMATCVLCHLGKHV